jgi:hypothetical protein
MSRALVKLLSLAAVAIPIAATGCTTAPAEDGGPGADGEQAEPMGETSNPITACTGARLVFAGTGLVAGLAAIGTAGCATGTIVLTFGATTIGCAPAAGFTFGAFASATLAAQNVQLMCREGGADVVRQTYWQPSINPWGDIVLPFSGIQLANELRSTRLARKVGNNAYCWDNGQSGSHLKIKCKSDLGECQTTVPQHRQDLKRGTLKGIQDQLSCLGEKWLSKL